MSEGARSQGTGGMGVPANPNGNSNSSSNYNNPQNYAYYQQASNMAYYQTMPSTQGNPYVVTTPASAVGSHGLMDSIFEIFDKVAKKIEEYLANIWQHLRIGPSLADTVMGRIAQGTKLLMEGGYENVFQTTFDVFPGEKLQKAYACYLSTSAGPVVGTSYLSNMRLAFCSDNPFDTPVLGQTQWSYYKVVVPLSDLKAVNPSANRMNSSEKYIQVVTSKGHDFWFLGFVTYDKALEHLQNVVRQQTMQTGGTH